MTSAAQASEKRRKTRGDFWYERPADLPANAPVPKYAYLVQQAMIASDGLIYRAMEAGIERLDGTRAKPQPLPRGQGRLLANASITAIAKATAAFTHDKLPMPRRTVAHRLASMRSKRILVPWEAETHARQSPTGLSWRFPTFDTILETWKNDPAIATPKKRTFYVVGKGRRHVTPEEAIAWKLKIEIAETNPAAHAAAAADDFSAPAAPPTEPENQSAAPQDLEPLKNALIDACDAASDEDAQYCWDAIATTCGKRDRPPIQEAVWMVEAIAREWHAIGKGRRPLTIGLIAGKDGKGGKIQGRVEAWIRNHKAEEAARAKAAKWERDERVNRLIEHMQQLAREDLPDEDRQWAAQALERADPAELDEAGRILDAIKARSA